MLYVFTLGLALSSMSAGASSEESAQEKPRIRIAIIGDSTVASYANPPKDRPDLTGWGQVFHEQLSDRAVVANHARSGRSSKSFLREGHWQKVLAEKPNYILIQFGHNDCPGKGDRSTDPETDFQDYLRTYIADARKISATPVLVTPMTRRRFENGKIHTILRPYAEAMLKVGREEGVAVVDLHQRSVELFDRLGDAGSADFSASLSDRTHFSRKGAQAMAALVAQELRKQKVLQEYLLADAAVGPGSALRGE